MAQMWAVVLVSLAVGSVADVPLGECHDCEITCFEDCSAKFQTEIMDADAREADFKARALARNGPHLTLLQGPSASPPASFSWRTQRPDVEEEQAKEQRQLKLSNAYIQCLQTDKCPGHGWSKGEKHVMTECRYPTAGGRKATKARGLKLLGASVNASDNSGCSLNSKACSQNCALKAAASLESAAALARTNLLQGRRQPAVPGTVTKSNFPLRPVERGQFEQGKITLDFCLKSCLAVTCGCNDAPGFEEPEKVEKITNQNDNLNQPVVDTEPQWQYEKATLAECAKGMFQAKVNEGLYVNFGRGYKEICTDDMLTGMYGKAFPHYGEYKRKCEARADKETWMFGCVWNNREEACVTGFTSASFPCFSRLHRDKQ